MKIRILALAAPTILAFTATSATEAADATQKVVSTWSPSDGKPLQEAAFPGSFAKYGYWLGKSFGSAPDVPPSVFPSTLKQGDIIRIVYYPETTNITASKPAQIQLALKGMDTAWTWTQIFDTVDLPAEGSVAEGNAYPELTFDYVIGSSQTTFKDYRDECESEGAAYVASVEDEINMMMYHGLFVKGTNWFLKSIDVIQVGDVPNRDQGWFNVKEYQVLAGDLGSWDRQISIPAATFEKALVGDRISFRGASQDDAQIQLNYQKGAEFVKLFSSNYEYVKEGRYDYVIADESQLNIVKTYGLEIKGQKFNISNVILMSQTEPQGGGGTEEPDDSPAHLYMFVKNAEGIWNYAAPVELDKKKMYSPVQHPSQA